MAVRVSPYAIALIDWNDPVNDPIRRQFIPLASTLLPDHPRLTLDSLHEQEDSPVPGLVHRYVDKALFLPLNVCPVYCRFCTRSYAIGPDTDERRQESRWRRRPNSGTTRSSTSRSAPSSKTSSSPAATRISFRRRTSS